MVLQVGRGASWATDPGPASSVRWAFSHDGLPSRTMAAPPNHRRSACKTVLLHYESLKLRATGRGGGGQGAPRAPASQRQRQSGSRAPGTGLPPPGVASTVASVTGLQGTANRKSCWTVCPLALRPSLRRSSAGTSCHDEPLAGVQGAGVHQVLCCDLPNVMRNPEHAAGGIQAEQAGVKAR